MVIAAVVHVFAAETVYVNGYDLLFAEFLTDPPNVPVRLE